MYSIGQGLIRAAVEHTFFERGYLRSTHRNENEGSTVVRNTSISAWRQPQLVQAQGRTVRPENGPGVQS